MHLVNLLFFPFMFGIILNSFGEIKPILLITLIYLLYVKY